MRKDMLYRQSAEESQKDNIYQQKEIDYKTRKISRNKKEHLIVMKVLINLKNIIPNVYALNSIFRIEVGN